MDGNFQDTRMMEGMSLENFQKQLMHTPSTSQDFHMSHQHRFNTYSNPRESFSNPRESFSNACESFSDTRETPSGEGEDGDDKTADEANAEGGDGETAKAFEDKVKEFLSNPEEEDKVTDKERDTEKVLKRIREMKQYGCGCSLKCDENFSEELILNYIQDIREMERAHREMIIMNCVAERGDAYSTKRGTKRQRMQYIYTVEGIKVCRNIFMLVFDVGKKKLKNLTHHFAEFGAVPRIHGNYGKKPRNSLQSDDIKYGLQFLLNFVDEYGMPQPGAPGPSDIPPPTFLPNNCTRKQIHDKYTICCGIANIRAVKYSSFGNIWRTLTPHLRVCNNKEDVCVVCDTLKKAIKEPPTPEVKQESEEELRQHVLLAQKAGEMYGACIEETRESYQSGAYDKYVHYTFGICQTLNLPHRSSSIGPVYFTALRKVRMFGFRIDGIPKQLSFLIDENETIGADGDEASGPNSIISMLDWAIDRYGADEDRCTFHGDYCIDHTNYWLLLAYFMWRTMTRRHEQIELMMQVPGHVQSLVESAFGSVKQMYRSSDCETVEQLEALITSASPTNEAVRYPAWKWRDWEGFLKPVFKEISDTREYHYFRVSSTDPGFVTVRSGIEEKETRINLLQKEDHQFTSSMPTEIKPGGLTHERTTYLYKRVRPFVHPSFQDRLCPEPPPQKN